MATKERDPLEQLVRDTRIHRDRLGAMKGPPDLRAEMGQNVWPWLEALADQIKDRLGALEEDLDDQAAALDELLSRASSVLTPKLGMQVAGLLGLAQQICTDFADQLQGIADSPRKERALAAIAEYQQGMAVVMPEVMAAIEAGQLASADGVDEPEDEDDDGDADADADEDEEQA